MQTIFNFLYAYWPAVRISWKLATSGKTLSH